MNSAYSNSGVNIDAGNRAVVLMRDAVRATYNKNVLAGIGAFGGLFDAGELKNLRAPVLVASTDGVGTKVKIAAQALHQRHFGTGRAPIIFYGLHCEFKTRSRKCRRDCDEHDGGVLRSELCFAWRRDGRDARRLFGK